MPRPSSGRFRVEGIPRICIKEMRERGVFGKYPWAGAPVRYPNSCESLESLDCEFTDNKSSVVFSTYIAKGRWARAVQLKWVPVHFGGKRPYFLCPNCYKRGVKLYLIDWELYCRKCTPTYYDCQREDRTWRRHSRAQKIRAKWNADRKPGSLFPQKPKHVHNITYQRAINKVANLEAEHVMLWHQDLRALLEHE